VKNKMQFIEYKENEITTLLLERYIDMLQDIEHYHNLKSMILKMFDTDDEILQIDINDLRRLVARSENTGFFKSKRNKVKNLILSN